MALPATNRPYLGEMPSAINQKEKDAGLMENPDEPEQSAVTPPIPDCLSSVWVDQLSDVQSGPLCP